MRCLKIGSALAATLLVLAPLESQGQSGEEFVLRSGRRIPASSVKPAAGGFTANIVSGGSAQRVDFKSSEVESLTLREPAELAESRSEIATEKWVRAAAVLENVEKSQLPYRGIPGGWWERARILRMDAIATRGDAKAAAALGDAKELSGLPASSAKLIRDFQTIISPAADGADAKIRAVREIAETSTDPWLAARARLEVGNTFSDHGKMEDAVKSWLRVAVFHPAERDLGVRGTILAARGLLQMGRPNDGVKLLEDFLVDYVASPYSAAIEAEIAKIRPKPETGTPSE